MSIPTIDTDQQGVYADILKWYSWVDIVARQWSPSFAVRNELERAAESIVLNTGEALALHQGKTKRLKFEYAIGSALESAACFDIGTIQGLVPPEFADVAKRDLRSVVNRLYKLRKPSRSTLREESTDYNDSTNIAHTQYCFSHERLGAYKFGKRLVQRIHRLAQEIQLSRDQWRKLDVASVATVLNTAEGNGRFSLTDQARFLSMARQQALRCGVYLDLLNARGILALETYIEIREIVDRTSAILYGLIASKTADESAGGPGVEGDSEGEMLL